MIYWVASYPRSGNTLLRIVLSELFNQGTYECEKFDQNLLPGFFERIGAVEPVQTSQAEFEAWARAVPEPVFVKTHKVPDDDSPVIFVLRDGRLSLDSYLSFHHEVIHNEDASLKRLIIGDDHYGSWSEFCAAALSAPGKVLALRFEEIVENTDAVVRQLAEFTGLAIPKQEWANPFADLSRALPFFFRKGQTRWTGAGRWSELDSAAFALLHGEVMDRLGYYAVGERDALVRGISSEFREYLQLAYRKSLEKMHAQGELEAKERVIQGLLHAAVATTD